MQPRWGIVMSSYKKTSLLSTTALAGFLGMLAALAPIQEARAACAPDPAVDGDTVTCTGTDTDGFTSAALNLTVNVEIGATVSADGGEIIDIVTGSVTNAGAISGTASEAAFEIVGLHARAGDISNSGSIDLTLSTPAANQFGGNSVIGIRSGAQSNSVNWFTISNTGSIGVSGSGDINIAMGIRSRGNFAVMNSGTISVSMQGNSSSAFGIADGKNGSINSGTIDVDLLGGDGFTATGLSLEGQLDSDPQPFDMSINRGNITVSVAGDNGTANGVQLVGRTISFLNENPITVTSTGAGNTLVGINATPNFTPSDFTVLNTGNVFVEGLGDDNIAKGITSDFSASDITNDGSVTASALAPGGIAFGADIQSNGSFTNNGTITVDGLAGSTGIFAEAGVSSGTTLTVTNWGSVVVSGSNAVGIDAPQSVAVINELGANIQSAGIGVKIGLEFTQSPSSASFVNRGSVISVGNAAIIGNAGNLAFSNEGLLRSTGANVEGAVVINREGGLSATYENLAGGVIEALGTSSDGVVVNLPSSANISFYNYGIISGTRNGYRGGDGLEQFHNFGQITGDVLFGGGNDLILETGLIDGSIDLGAGNDRIIFGPGSSVTGNISGGDGDDEFQAATFLSTDSILVDLSKVSEFERFRAIGAGTVTIRGAGDFQTLEAGGIFFSGEDKAGELVLEGADLIAPRLSLSGPPSGLESQSLSLDSASSLTLTSSVGGIFSWINAAITNAGLIDSANVGIRFDSGGSFVNSGTLDAQNIAVEITSFVSGPGATITNSGSISATIAVLGGGNDDTVLNTGAIIGDLDGGLGFDILTNGLGGSIIGAVTGFESIDNSGILDLSDQNGVFAIGGDLTLTATSDLTLRMEAGGPTPAQITGSALLGGDLKVKFSFSSDTEVFAGDQFTVLAAGGGVTGTFSSLDISSNPFVDGSLIYTANGVSLQLNRSSFLLPVLDIYQRGVAAAMDSMASAGVTGQAGGMIQILTFSQVPEAMSIFDQLPTGAAAELATPVLEARHGYLSHLSSRAGDLAGLKGTEGRWVTDIAGYGAFGNAAGSKYSSGGAVAISAYGVNDRLTVGFAMAGTASDLRLQQQFGENGHTALDVAGFAGYRTGSLFLSTVLGASYDEIDTERSVLTTGFEGTSTGGASGVGYSAAIDARYDFSLAGFDVVPEASFRLASFHHGGYEEEGLGNLGLRFGGRTVTSARASSGLSLKKTFRSVSGLEVTPEVGAFYEREVGERDRSVMASFIADPDTSFLIQGIAADRSRARLTGGLTARFSDSLSAAFRYEGALGAIHTTHQITGGLRLTW